MVQIQHPSSIDVSSNNPNDIVYIKGNETTDGSIRLIINGQDITSLESRALGVWNRSELELSGKTLFLGSNLALAAVGSSLLIKSLEGSKKFIGIDAEFNDEGSLPPRSPLVGELVPRLILQPIFSTEEISKIFTRAATIEQPISGFGSVFYLKTGSKDATAPVTIEITGGLVPGGDTFFKEEFPASVFPKNTEVVIPLSTPVGFFAGQSILSTVFSADEFSLLGDIGGEFWVAFDFQFVEFEELLPHSSGTDRILSDDNGNILVDEQGNLIVRQFYSDPIQTIIFS